MAIYLNIVSITAVLYCDAPVNIKGNTFIFTTMEKDIINYYTLIHKSHNQIDSEEYMSSSLARRQWLVYTKS